jgi:hypothetical protein
MLQAAERVFAPSYGSSRDLIGATTTAVFAAAGSFEARRYYEACGRAQSRIAVFDSGGINVD